MGFLFSKIMNYFTKSKNNFKLIIVGIQNVGKTTILYRMSLKELVVTQPTIGANVEEIVHNNVKFQAFDLGGQESMRSVWDAYYSNVDVSDLLNICIIILLMILYFDFIKIILRIANIAIYNRITIFIYLILLISLSMTYL